MKLYIDTNTYLSYISPNSDVDSLNKLLELIMQGQVELVLPSQTKEEFIRHFNERVKDRKEKITKNNSYFPIPKDITVDKKIKNNDLEKALIKEIENINSSLKKYWKEKKENLEKHIKIVESLIKELFMAAVFLEYTDETIMKAVIRYAKDLPPKKNDHKFGDSIIWETLKENIKREDLVIVSSDPDFSEKKKNNKKLIINKTLSLEWKKQTGKDVKLFLVLGEFINTLEKKDKISKETIKKETENLQTWGIANGSDIRLTTYNSAAGNNNFNPAGVQGGAWGNHISTVVTDNNSYVNSASIVANSVNSYDGPVSNALLFNVLRDNGAICCPYCGGYSLSISNYLSAWQLGETEVFCKSCKKKFKINS